ncbi:MAG TPA: phospholipase D-like domain-containing protein [Bacteroidia bacterium]|nr:phospholipase D-like domain-containing protein [Bacteroidia bacterium]
MKKGLLSIAALSISFFCASQTILQQEDFTTYDGTSATIPAGWTFSYNGNYTTVASSGTSGPNSYKFGANNATISTPQFSGADSVQFWVKGLSTDAVSMLVCLESPDNVTWDTVAKVKPVPATGTTLHYHVSSSAQYTRFTYVKSAGNVAFDDYRLIRNNAQANSPGNITVYFNHPVNTSVSNGVNAVYLNQSIDDTLIAYINRAKYSLDIAVYNYIQTSAISNIATAINNAYARGVKIRWIYNGSSSNSGLSQLNANIHTLGSPTTSTYGIMHNKFMIVDAHSSDPSDPLVWTGSCNWDEQQINSDANNVIIIQDNNLAAAYTTEFNEMWGDTGLVPNVANSKFGPDKTDNTPHTFTIGSRTVELYFSPSDGTNNHILSAINSADNTLYFGVYTFTDATDANAIKTKDLAGVYTAGIIDQYSTSYTPYSTLSPVMGNRLRVYTQSNSIYHNKFLIADDCDSTSDPVVLTGSHNWTVSADTKNDENTLIIHSAVIANIYFQAFDQNFIDLGGTLSPPCVFTTGMQTPEANDRFNVYPDPARDQLNIEASAGAKILVTDETGRAVMQFIAPGENAFAIDISSLVPGLYFVREETATGISTRKIIVQ